MAKLVLGFLFFVFSFLVLFSKVALADTASAVDYMGVESQLSVYLCFQSPTRL